MYSNEEIAKTALLRASAIAARRKREERLRKKAAVAVLSFCAIMAIVVFVSPGAGPPDGKTTIEDENPPLAAAPAAPGVIFPGAEGVAIPAGSTEVNIFIGNPAENCNPIVIEIVLAETGEKLCETGPIAPGESVESVTLTRPPDKGTYRAVLTAREYIPGGLGEPGETSAAFDLTAE